MRRVFQPGLWIRAVFCMGNFGPYRFQKWFQIYGAHHIDRKHRGVPQTIRLLFFERESDPLRALRACSSSETPQNAKTCSNVGSQAQEQSVSTRLARTSSSRDLLQNDSCSSKLTGDRQFSLIRSGSVLLLHSFMKGLIHRKVKIGCDRAHDVHVVRILP